MSKTIEKTRIGTPGSMREYPKGAPIPIEEGGDPVSMNANVPAQAGNGSVSRLNNLNTTKHRVFDKAVLVRMDEPLTQTSGGIWIPPEARDKQQLAELYGTIIQMGVNAFAEAKREAASVGEGCDCPQVGDRVTIARYAGVMLDPKKVGGGHVRMMNDEDIIAIVEDD